MSKKPNADNKFHLHIQMKYRSKMTPTKKTYQERALKKYKATPID